MMIHDGEIEKLLDRFETFYDCWIWGIACVMLGGFIIALLNNLEMKLWVGIPLIFGLVMNMHNLLMRLWLLRRTTRKVTNCL